MKSFLIVFFVLISSYSGFAQLENKPEPKKKDWTKVDLSKRSSDHLMLQFGYTNWTKKPDSIRTDGFSRSFNIYFLFDFPFKTNPKLSVAIGAGVGTDNIFFERTSIDIINPRQIEFNKDSIVQYKKYKLATGYGEIPLEFRYSSNPENMNKGFKFAIGAKVGLGYDMHTKAKIDLDANGRNGYIEKVKDKQFLNNTRFVGTVRFGYGNFTAFGTYGLNQMFREGQGPAVRPWTIGLCLSGL